jgi:hypothetical protein
MGCGASGTASHQAEKALPTLDAVRDALRARGFETSQIVGIAFDYTASNLRVRWGWARPCDGRGDGCAPCRTVE